MSLLLVTKARLLLTGSALAAPIIPPTWDAVADDFESGSLADWQTGTPTNLSLVAGAGRNGSTGLQIALNQDKGYISQAHVGYAKEGYLTFWFNPNGAILPAEIIMPLAQVRGPGYEWPPLVELRMIKPTNQGYRGYLAWPKADGYFYDRDGLFDLANDWQKITLGYHIDAWVAVWVNDTLVRYDDSDVVHDEPVGDVIYLGKVEENIDNPPSGALLMDDVAFQVPYVDDLWVKANGGSDSNDGLTSDTAFSTIQKAANMAGPGTTVHILPGVYRETVWPFLSGTADKRVTYRAENGPDTVFIRGSEPTSSLTWTQLTADSIGLPDGVDPTEIYAADLSDWELEDTPRFVVRLDASGEVMARLPLAREPDWDVATAWKRHEFWWAADGGSGPAECDPITDEDHDCDRPQRSATQLTDGTDDTEPAGIEAGNLTTLGDLTGATLVVLDTVYGHYTYRPTITAHEVGAGRITVDKSCSADGSAPGLGWGSKYYVENSPRLLDNPGEWWYDSETQQLYLWPPVEDNPANLDIEISKRDIGFSLRDRSYTTLDGLAIELFNQVAVHQGNWGAEKAYHNTVHNVTLRYANRGVSVQARISPGYSPEDVVDGFTLENSEIAYMDTNAIFVQNSWENSPNPDAFTHSGVVNTLIRNNEIHNIGFRSEATSSSAVALQYADHLRFENNHIYDIVHHGASIFKSVIQSSKTYGFEPSEIKTGHILIKDNVFERTCQGSGDCCGLKFMGGPPDNHVFRDLLVTENVFRDTYGWTYIAEKRGDFYGGTDSQARGMGGYGMCQDYASGVHAYRNIAYNNANIGYGLYGTWRDGDIVYYNNIAANSVYGFSLGGPQFDTHGNVNTQIANNIIVNSERFGILATRATSTTFENVTIDRTLYFNNGWRSYEDGGAWKPGNMIVSPGPSSTWAYYQTLDDIRTNTAWEDHGLEGDPVFGNYNMDDHEMFDGSWPDFHLASSGSLAIDQGTEDLPDSLVTLLDAFSLTDYKRGTAYDIGRYEAGFALLAQPSAQVIAPGGVAHYRLRIEPDDPTYSITLTATSPSSDLLLDLSPVVISASGSATLTLTDTHAGTSLLPGMRYTIPVTGSSGGFSQTTTVSLLVGGADIYLPLVLR